jgi:gamma-glutamylcyclotransferase (GGCT)/AIG2-like uncharacterized protein YtfP
MRQYLFLYGTLLPDHAPLSMVKVVRRLHLIGPAQVRGRLYDLGRYPGAVLDHTGANTISGQVFVIPEQDAELLALLDGYEQFNPADQKNSLFVRKECHAVTADGRTLKCWIYAYNRGIGSARLIASGNYAEDKLKSASSAE